MKRRDEDTSLFLALVASLVVHAGVTVIALQSYTREVGSLLQWRPSAPVEAAIARGDLPRPIDSPPPPRPQIEPPATRRPGEKPLPPLLDFTDNSEWGEANGKGFAITSSPGERPMEARKGPEDQSFGSRDPQGPGPIPEEPSPSTVLPGQGGDGGVPARKALAGAGTAGSQGVILGLPGAQPATPVIPPPPIVTRPVPQELRPDSAQELARSSPESDRPPMQILPASPSRIIGLENPQAWPEVVDALIRPPGQMDTTTSAVELPVLAPVMEAPWVVEQDAIVAMIAPEPSPEPMAQRIEQAAPPMVLVRRGSAGSAANASGGIPGPPMPAADPAPDTGFESDPFAKIPGVHFRSGKVEARSGRQIKPIRPRLSEAGKRDLLAMQFPTILLKVRIDNTGNVTDVTVLRGSGSEAVDMPVYRALWGWWFEPPKDKAGRPLPDVQLVAIHWE